MSNTGPVRLLWSGGWDSSFRLLQSLLIRRRKVQPYYVIDTDRLSTGAEIRAMDNIKTQLFGEHPEIQELLLPTQFRDVLDIAKDHEITEALSTIRRHSRLGVQYDWLARFAREFGSAGMELCITCWDTVPHKLLAPHVREIIMQGEPTYVIGDDVRGTAEYTLFKYFTFPLFHVTKMDLQRFSAEAGFGDLMELTWFCHHPRPDGAPCGTCNPCLYAVEQGMGWRLPLVSRIRNRVYRLLRHPTLEHLFAKMMI